MDKKDYGYTKLDFKGVTYPYSAYEDVSKSIPAPTPTPTRPNVRAALDYLDGIFARGGQDAQDLWDIVTAFRGPDQTGDYSFYRNSPYQDESLKREVTIPIRRAALPLTTTVVERERSAYDKRSDIGVHTRAHFGYATQGHWSYAGPRSESTNHFGQHGCRAAKALGLIA